MINDLFETICKSIITQFNIPRKGVTMILFAFMSLIILLLNKYQALQSFIPNGCILSQLLYGVWIYSIVAPIIKGYNEYCDKKDAKKRALKDEQEVKEKLSRFLETIEYCTPDEKEKLALFYLNQTTSINTDNLELIRIMNKKGLPFIYTNLDYSGYAYTTNAGLKIINKYFDKQKPAFFEVLDGLEDAEIKLLYDFIKMNDEQISLYKKEKITAKNIILKFNGKNFDDIYIDSDGFFTISILYHAYLDKYFFE